MKVRYERQKSHLSAVPIYPFLLAIYPTFALLANNAGELLPAAAVRALIVSLAGCMVLYIMLYVLLRESHRAAFVTSAWLFLFIFFGHVQILFPDQEWTRLKFLFPLWIGIGLLCLLWVWLFRPTLHRITLSFTVGSLLLVGMSIWQFTSSEMKLMRLVATPPTQEPLPTLQVDETSPKPDIYYIVLDSYTRADTLFNIYGYDNTQFISELDEMGFYVARCSQSNYDRTELVFASMLNLDYLQTIVPSLTPERTDKSTLWSLIRNNRIRAVLEKFSYQTVAFATGYPWSELVDADRYIQPELKWNDLNEFEILLLRTTLLRAAQEVGWFHYDAQEFDRQSERSRLTLATLPSLPRVGQPRFFFVHLLEPHPPFVFDADGNSIDAGQFINEKGKYTPESYARLHR